MSQNTGQQQYKDPAGGVASSIGPQSVTHFHIKKSLVEARKKQYFTQLADVKNMPKHFGKTMKVFEYVPLLDDRNVNDQGIDASGATIADGNLYGSSKDIGTITGKLPLLGETGGRVNRVGFTRVEWEGTIAKFGFFREFTQESMDFDSDPELMQHLSTEMLNGAVEISEDVLQKDLLLAAGVVHYAGDATSHDTVTAEGDGAAVVTYDDLSRVAMTLDENRTPKQTKVITGTRMIDTRTVAGGRIMYAGSEMIPVLERIKDPFGNQAWIPVHKYAAAGTVLEGEEGSVGKFRVVQVPEMQHWAGEGAAVTDNPGYRATGSNYDVYPLLVVGGEAFSTIGFQTDGKVVKFKIITKMPGEKTADRNDPYGETGFSSIKWYYGTIVYRPERIAVIKAVAPV